MKTGRFVALAGLTLLAAGCGDTKEAEPTATTSAPDLAAGFLVSSEPADGRDVIDVRKDAADGDDIVIIGRIGGSADPWIEGRAAFSIVDRSLKPCNEIPGDKCPVPWDYCCQTDLLPEATALVKFNDTEGKLLKSGAKEMLKVKELDTVVIAGKAKRDDAGNLTVLAQSMFVRAPKKQ